MANKNLRKVVTVFFIGLALFVGFIAWGITQLQYRAGARIAVYDGFLVYGYGFGPFGFGGNQQFEKLTVDLEEGQVVPVYVELPDGQRYLIGDLPEEVAAKFLIRGRLPDSVCTHYTDREFSGYPRPDISLVFKNGRLSRGSIKSDFSKLKFRISGHKDGPYFELPIDRATLDQEFGKPLQWKKKRITNLFGSIFP